MSMIATNNPICNLNPEQGKFRQIGWKTINGWNYESKKLSYCLKTCKYTWHITINIHHVLTDNEHRAIWQAATRIFRQHFTAFYIREPTVNNLVGYHVLVNSEISKEQLRKCIESAFPQLKITFSIAEIYSRFGICDYITKQGKKYSNKRVYFAKYCTLNKHGTIGKFWHKPTKQLWQDCIETERQLSGNLNEGYNAIQPAAKYLHWLVCGYIPFKAIRRNLAKHWPNNKETVNDLAEQCRINYDEIIYFERNER